MGKKGSNILKGGIPDKPRYPGTRPPAPEMPITLTKAKLIAIFNEWNERYSKNPNDFSGSLDADGNAVSDYGEKCAIYFKKLYTEGE